MIHSIRIQNFKSILDSGWISIKPITFLYGPNASGKSAVLKAIQFLAETFNLSNDMSTPCLNSTEIDLGEFKNMVHKNNLKNPLIISLKYNISSHIVRFVWKCKYIDENSYDINQSIILIPLMTRITINQKDSRSSTSHGYIQSISKKSENNFYEYDTRQEKVLKREILQDFDDLNQHNDFKLIEMGKLITDQYKRFSSDIKNYPNFDFESLSLRCIMAQHTDWIPSPHILLLNQDEEKSLPLEQRTLFMQRIPRDYIYFIENAYAELYYCIRSISHIGPYRKPLSRDHVKTGNQLKSNIFVAADGRNVDLIISSNSDKINLLAKINSCLDKIKLNYHIHLSQIKNHPLYKKLDIITVEDLITKVQCGIVDVGHGVSQVIPIIVELLNERTKIVSIEQPELHLHPAQQADLAEIIFYYSNLFIDDRVSMNSEPMYIMETHSEYMMLRLQKLIRTQKINNENASILYVSRNDNGESEIRKIALDEYGDMIDEWPNGFFEERYKE